MRVQKSILTVLVVFLPTFFVYGQRLAIHNTSVIRPVKEEKEVNVVHATASTKTLTVYDDVALGRYSNGFCMICEKNTGNAVIANTSGEITGKIKLKANFWGPVPSFDSTGHTIVELPDTFAIIDTRGNIVTKLGPSVNTAQFVDGVAKISEAPLSSFNPTTRYINVKGEHVFPKYNKPGVVYDDPVFPIADGRRLDMVKENADPLFGYMDINGEPITAHIYPQAHSFSEGVAAVASYYQNQILWGFIDVSGKYVIEPKFTNEPDDFHEGYCVVKKANGTYCYIDKNGNAVSTEYTYASPFVGGYARVSVDFKKDYVIDKNFAKIKEIEILSPFTKGKNIYGPDVVEADGLYSPSGIKLLKCRYPYFTEDGISIISEDDVKGYINTKGEIILRVVRSEF